MAVNPDKNGVEQSLIARLIGKIKRIVLDINGAVSAEEIRATAAEAAAKTEVVQGENCTIEKTAAADGHDVYTINADGKPQIPADWEQQDSGKPDYVKNKPNLALKEDIANKKQSIDPTSTTEYGSSKAVADFVNSSVATNTANFLGSFSLADLSLTYPATDVQIAAALNSHTWPSGVTPTNNDYVYVEIQNPQTTGVDDKVERFKFSDMLESWGYEYTLNNSSFTAAEMATLESGITASDKTAWNSHVSNTSNPHNVTAAQVGAEPAFSVLPVSKGGTNAGSANEAVYNLFNNISTFYGAPNDDSLIPFKLGTPSAANGFFFLRKASYLWEYIKGNISSVLGLSENGYTGNAASATSATNATTAAGYTNDGAIATALAGKYVKPSGGIPKTDLASDVQTSLGKADSALQAHQSVTDSDPTLSWGNRSKVGSVGSTDLHVTMPANPASGKEDAFIRNGSASPYVIFEKDISTALYDGQRFEMVSSWGDNTYKIVGRLRFPATTSANPLNGCSLVFASYPEKPVFEFYYKLTDIGTSTRLTLVLHLLNTGNSVVTVKPTVMSMDVVTTYDTTGFTRLDTFPTLINMRDASWINSGTFGTDRIADDAITAAKVKDNETLPVNISGTAKHLDCYGLWHTYGTGYYNAATPYARIGELSLNIAGNTGAGQLLQFELDSGIYARIRLDIKWSNGSLQRSNALIIDSSVDYSALQDWIKIAYFTYTSGSNTFLCIRLYVKFTGDWQVWRVRQLDCQTGDCGYTNWADFPLRVGYRSDLDSATGTLVTYKFSYPYANEQKGSDTIPVYVDPNGLVKPCTPLSMSVGSATSATNVNLSKIADSTIGDTIKAGNGSSVIVDNAGNAYRWGGYRLSFGTFSIQDNTICIV